MMADLYIPGADWALEKCSAGGGCTCRFANIIVWVWRVVDAGTGMIVDHTIDVDVVKFVLRVDKVLPESSPGFY